MQQQTHDNDDNTPVIAIDYMFMTNAKRKDANEEEASIDDDMGMSTLIVKDTKPGTTKARVVPKKGRHPYAIKRLGQAIGYFAYQRLMLKHDQEPAIKELKEHVKRGRIWDIMFEESLVGE